MPHADAFVSLYQIFATVVDGGLLNNIVAKKTAASVPFEEGIFNNCNNTQSGADYQQLTLSFNSTCNNNSRLSQYIEEDVKTDETDERNNRKLVQQNYNFGMLQVVTPTPAFVMKTKRMDNTKVFVNVCSHALVPYNGDDESDSTKLIYMLVGAPIEHNSEKESNYCVVYDVVVHPKVVSSAVVDSRRKANSKVSGLT